ncbi:MAG: PKD domain-containing protein [Bacteroidota bacterium]
MKISFIIKTILLFLIGNFGLYFFAQAQITADKTEGCQPLVVSFGLENNEFQSVNWIFGDGQTSNAESPTIIFEDTGDFDVMAVLNKESGEKDTLSANNMIAVSDSPIADFSVENETLCFGQAISFINESENALEYQWSFGDGNQSSEENPTHEYDEPGTYTVTLTAKSLGDCQDLKVREDFIEVSEAMEVNASVNSFTQCLQDDVPLEFDLSGDISEANWDFGDGETLEGIAVEHVYSSIGSYDVSVEYVDANGCSGTIQMDSAIQVTEIEAPQIVVDNVNVCLGESLNLSADHPSSASFEWTVNGTVYEGKSVSIAFYQPGFHDVLLSYTDPNGCTVEVLEEDLIEVDEVSEPVIEYNETTACAPFNFTATNQTEGAVAYSWKIGNQTIDGQELEYTFENHGNYEVVAITEYESGCVIEQNLDDRIQVFKRETNLRVEEWQGCAPFATEVSLLNGGANEIIWDNGDGQQYEGDEVNFEYENPGDYYPSVSYINNKGCQVEYEFENPISVLNSSINLSDPEVIESCTYTEVQFSGSMGYDYWEWDFGDGNTSTEQNPMHAYSEAGNYEVSLTTHNRNGCATTIERYNIIEIPDLNPDAEYEVTKGDDCGMFRVDLSTEIQEGQSAKWYYNENLVGNGSELSLSFITLGNVSLTLNVQSDGQCSKSKAIMVPNPWSDCENPDIVDDEEEDTEDDSPIGRFTFSSCNVPYSLDIVNPVPDASYFEWKFDDKDSHSDARFNEDFTSVGEYTIDYFAQFSKDSSFLVEDYITVSINDPFIDFDYQLEKVCEGFKVFLSPENPDYENYNWKINNANVELAADGSYLLENEGLYSVSLSASGQSNCEATKIKNIYIGNDEYQFEYPNALCLGEGLTISHNLEGFESFEWDMGNGDSVSNFDSEYVYSESGKYKVSMIATDFDGCEYNYELSDSIEIKSPRAEFTANKTQGCGEVQVRFQNQSEGATSWLWDFGNGQTSTKKNPKVKFQAGNYNVSLIAINGECRDSIEYSNFINIDELSSDFSFEYDQSCLPVSVSFQDESVNATNWLWDFGDGNTSTEQNPTHTYYEIPENNVKLTVENENGCKQSSKKLLSFIFSADFQVDANEVCVGKTVNFSGISDDAVSWIWDFGDGNSSTDRNPSHQYDSQGIYDVSLIAANESGCQDTVIMEQFIEVSPYKADFELKESIQNSCVPVQVEFNDLSEGAISYHWDFGDGKTSRVASPVHLYKDVGNFDVTLVITNKLGCQDTLRQEQLVNVSGPETEFEIEEKVVCLPNTANFTDISTSAVQWEWIFGDGNTSNEQNPQHLYEEPGVYDVSLIAQNEDGCEQVYKMKDIKVLPTPEVDFDMEISGECYPVEVKLTNNSTNLLQPTYLWDFGNGQTSTEESPTVLIEDTGEFDVSLTVKNDDGCPVSFTHANQVLVRDTVNHEEADLNQILVENNRVQFEFEPYNYNNISHYNVYRDSPSGFDLLQTIELGGQNQRVKYDDQNCRPQDMSHQYIFQAVSYCEDTVDRDELTVFNTLHLLRESEKEKERIINWNESKGFSIDNQRIFRKLKGDEQWQEIAVMEINALSFQDEEDLCPGIYEYRVGAFEQNSLRSVSNYVEFEVTDEIYVNQVAEIQNSTVMESGEVFIEWSIPDEGKGRITAFEIYRSENGGDFKYFDSVEPHEQFYIDEESDTENKSYNYQVKVVNDCTIDTESSDESNTVLLKKDVQFRKYELKWNAFKGWEEGVKKYVIQRLNEDGEWETVEEVSGDQLKTIIRDTDN